jgi:hypothetical protein
MFNRYSRLKLVYACTNHAGGWSHAPESLNFMSEVGRNRRGTTTEWSFSPKDTLREAWWAAKIFELNSIAITFT